MFSEENTVEKMVLDMLCSGVTSKMVAEKLACYGDTLNRNQKGLFNGI
ncbi:MAG: hypothetical protein HGA87_04655 [Desulfobulbaceae bacterium]|nr:hypothetical protein [Desulfobulbaceae bacterium]